MININYSTIIPSANRAGSPSHRAEFRWEACLQSHGDAHVHALRVGHDDTAWPLTLADELALSLEGGCNGGDARIDCLVGGPHRRMGRVPHFVVEHSLKDCFANFFCRRLRSVW
jgi:hypothetical protein